MSTGIECEDVLKAERQRSAELVDLMHHREQIHAASLDALRARVAELETQWASVPWDLLMEVSNSAYGYGWEDYGKLPDVDAERLFAWLDAHAPKEHASVPASAENSPVAAF